MQVQIPTQRRIKILHRWAQSFYREERTYTTTTERKSIGELFWPQRKTFQASGRYKHPTKTREAISTAEIFPLWPRFFFGKEKLEQGGVCFLLSQLYPVLAPRSEGRLGEIEMSIKLSVREVWVSRPPREGREKSEVSKRGWRTEGVGTRKSLP